ncbi:phage tail tape measure protein [Christiangramia sp. SM2212]|uniref:Phage tail tape measure protein n=1 Tax=Christiangramia sediminicola TaxID=3073267 RepID=A0ABU1ES31_9FLAO|nr:phage tail tape measure protein [Christiangramia sp. SM2212]MDR5591209.1 phage tail tape measure protein [Christiangramia sp. SM2212]
MSKFGQQMQSVGSGLTLGVTLPILGLGAASVKAASDAEETSSKFNTVFRDISEAASKAATELRNSYGLSSKASQQLLSDTGDLLTGFGFSQQSALDLSTEVNKLAVDLASFTNFSGGAEGASQALTKALLGERESVKSLGISILESDVKARVLQNTQAGLTFETERQSKAFATLQLAQEQSKNAIGDYARTNEGFANQMRLLKARIEDVAVQFGEILLPYVTKLAGKLGELINWFSSLDPAVKKTIVVVAGLAAALGPVLATMGILVANIIPAMAAGFTALTGPIGFVIAALAGIAVVIAKNWEPIKETLFEVRNYFIDLYNESIVFRAGAESIILVFKNLYNTVKLVVDFIVTGFTNGIEFILGSVENLGKAFKAVLTGEFRSIPKILQEQGKFAAENFRGLIDDLSGDIDRFSSQMKNNVNDAIDSVTLRKKLTFTKENIDTTAIQQAVYNAVSAGQNGIGGGRAQITTIDAGVQAGDVSISNPLDGLAADLPNKIELIKTQFQNFRTDLIDVTSEVNGALQGLAANTAQFFGEFVGNIFTGQATARDALSGLMSVVSDFMKGLGQAMIAAGVASEAFKNLFASGVGAIAAGATLIALSGVVGALLKSAPASGGGSRPRAFANGGIVYTPTNALVGEYSGARSNPEVIAPLDKLKGMIADVSSGGNVQVYGEFKIRNRDLVAQIDSARKHQSRLS